MFVIIHVAFINKMISVHPCYLTHNYTPNVAWNYGSNDKNRGKLQRTT